MKKVQIDSTCGTATAEVRVNTIITDWRGKVIAFKGSVSVTDIRGNKNTYKGVFSVSLDTLEVFYLPEKAVTFLMIEAIIKTGDIKP